MCLRNTHARFISVTSIKLRFGNIRVAKRYNIERMHDAVRFIEHNYVDPEFISLTIKTGKWMKSTSTE